jgi:hypothetical protein
MNACILQYHRISRVSTRHDPGCIMLVMMQRKFTLLIVLFNASICLVVDQQFTSIKFRQRGILSSKIYVFICDLRAYLLLATSPLAVPLIPLLHTVFHHIWSYLGPGIRGVGKLGGEKWELGGGKISWLTLKACREWTVGSHPPLPPIATLCGCGLEYTHCPLSCIS